MHCLVFILLRGQDEASLGVEGEKEKQTLKPPESLLVDTEGAAGEGELWVCRASAPKTGLGRGKV